MFIEIGLLCFVMKSLLFMLFMSLVSVDGEESNMIVTDGDMGFFVLLGIAMVALLIAVCVLAAYYVELTNKVERYRKTVRKLALEVEEMTSKNEMLQMELNNNISRLETTTKKWSIAPIQNSSSSENMIESPKITPLMMPETDGPLPEEETAKSESESSAHSYKTPPETHLEAAIEALIAKQGKDKSVVIDMEGESESSQSTLTEEQTQSSPEKATDDRLAAGKEIVDGQESMYDDYSWTNTILQTSFTPSRPDIHIRAERSAEKLNRLHQQARSGGKIHSYSKEKKWSNDQKHELKLFCNLKDSRSLKGNKMKNMTNGSDC